MPTGRIHSRSLLLVLCQTLSLALALPGCEREPLAPLAGTQRPEYLIVATHTFIQVTAGGAHGCALRDDGVVECWGFNSSGEALATRSASRGQFTQVSAGHGHTCARRDDGVVECWGVDAEGQAPAVRDAETGGFTQVSAGSGHTCALRDVGVVECWGGNFWGQAPATRDAASGFTFTQVSAGFSHTCALTDGIGIGGMIECWGNANSYELNPGAFTQVSVGASHACALRDNGVVQCVNGPGQAPASRPASNGHTFAQVSVGNEFTCGLRDDGVVECWGEEDFIDFQQAPATRPAAPGRTFIGMAAGGSFACALRDDGVVECWGDNSLGQAPETRSASATRVLPIATFSATPGSVVAGQLFTLALDDAQVPGYTGTVGFTWAFDCGDGIGYGAFGSSQTRSCPTSTIGTRTVKGTVRDQDGDETEYSAEVTITPRFIFSGFVAPVDNLPTVNVAKAGSTVPVNFSLGGDRGLDVFDGGYPTSVRLGCASSSPEDQVSGTVTAGKSSLSWDAATDLYTYIWKTDKAWAVTCRTLTLRFIDGTEASASFKFTR
jgi:alpha-tubulin suppressor-like RCC1 family protein